MYDAIVNLLQRVDPTVFIVLALVFGFAFGTAIITTIITQIGKYRLREQELEFKREMLLNGVPAQEIERALAAQMKEPEPKTPVYNGSVVIHQTSPYQPATAQK
jgi:Na+-translocating ferredoxin:NAD+ oxidoreductase RnfG subunit